MKIVIVLCALLLWFGSLPAQTLTTIADKPGQHLGQPAGLATGPDGALYFGDVESHRIMRLDLKTHAVTAVAGTGTKGNAGDGGPASDAVLDEPYEIAFNKAGDLFFCDRLNHVVRRIDRVTHRISTVAGTGADGFSGDGGPAGLAQLKEPHSLAFTPEGLLLIGDIRDFRIRAVDPGTGIISTWAGTGQRGAAPEGAPLTGTPLDGPRALAIDARGNYYLALREGNSIYRLDVKAGRMYRFAGTGDKGFSGDGGDARLATLSGPKGLACGPDGSVYIADTENNAIRRVDPKGVITTVAGKLSRPHGVFVDRRGVVYIGDTEGHRILTLSEVTRP